MFSWWLVHYTVFLLSCFEDNYILLTHFLQFLIYFTCQVKVNKHNLGLFYYQDSFNQLLLQYIILFKDPSSSVIFCKVSLKLLTKNLFQYYFSGILKVPPPSQMLFNKDSQLMEDDKTLAEYALTSVTARAQCPAPIGLALRYHLQIILCYPL